MIILSIFSQTSKIGYVRGFGKSQFYCSKILSTSFFLISTNSFLLLFRFFINSLKTFSALYWQKRLKQRRRTFSFIYIPIQRDASVINDYGISGSTLRHNYAQASIMGEISRIFSDSYQKTNQFLVCSSFIYQVFFPLIINKNQNFSLQIQIIFYFMAQQSESLATCTGLCRPLLTTLYELSKGDQISRCIQLPYIYHLNDVKNLENYLCKSIKIIGIDFLQKPNPFPKLKYKNLMISSSFVGEKREKIQFQSMKNYVKLSWMIDIVTSYPENSHQTSAEVKKKLTKSIRFYNLSQELITESLISLQKLKKSKINCTIKRQKNKKQQKLFKCRVPVRILLPSLKEYEIQNILNIICEDLSNSIDIMIKSSMMYRVTQWHEDLIPIQNFLNSQAQEQKLADKIFQKLSKFNSSKRIQEKEKQSMGTKETWLIQNDKFKNNANPLLILTLVFVLIVIVGGYGYIKIY